MMYQDFLREGGNRLEPFHRAQRNIICKIPIDNGTSCTCRKHRETTVKVSCCVTQTKRIFVSLLSLTPDQLAKQAYRYYHEQTQHIILAPKDVRQERWD
jgi:hypothetical protein